MKKILIYIVVCITGTICAACVRGSSASSIVETSITETTERQTVKEQESLSVLPTETEYLEEINTVESLEDDGKDMSAAEALRSAMKGKRSALELTRDERFFLLRDGDGPRYAEEVKDMSTDGLRRINLHKYNRGAGGVSPIWTEAWDKWERFICVDLNQDGTKEVLLEGNAINVFLHYKDGEVYLTEPIPRLFPYLVYENGICLDGAGGAFSTGYNRLYPAKGAMYIEQIAYMDERDDYHGDIPQYKIKDKGVTKDEYEDYIEQLIGGLTQLEWHEFTEENIDKYVVD